MPLYDYECVCGHKFETFRTMKDESFEQCPTCKSYATNRVPSLPHTDLKAFHTPIEMFSIALDTPEEVRAFKQRCPDVEMCDDPSSEMFGLPVAHNRKQKTQALAAAGYVEKT